MLVKVSLPFREDPSNESDAYMRNRYRRHILPQVLKENPMAPEKAVMMGASFKKMKRFFEALAKERLEKMLEFTDEGLPSINRRAFTDMPTALQRRMIPLLLGYLYDEENAPEYYKSALVEQILHHLRSQRRKCLNRFAA